MARRQFVECDRCHAIVGEDLQDRNTWSRAYVATISGRDIVGSGEDPADLCDLCTDALRNFMLGEISERRAENAKR